MIVEFQPAHLEAVAGTLPECRWPEVRDRMRLLAWNGMARSILVEGGGEVLGVAGVVPRPGGVGEVFILADDSRKKHRVTFVRCVRRILGDAREMFPGGLEALAGEGTPDKWFELLGFARTGAERDGEAVWRLLV